MSYSYRDENRPGCGHALKDGEFAYGITNPGATLWQWLLEIVPPRSSKTVSAMSRSCVTTMRVLPRFRHV